MSPLAFSSQVDGHSRGSGAVTCFVDGIQRDRVHDTERQIHGELVRVRIDGRAIQHPVQVQVVPDCAKAASELATETSRITQIASNASFCIVTLVSSSPRVSASRGKVAATCETAIGR
jgi:hypothetical protein